MADTDTDDRADGLWTLLEGEQTAAGKRYSLQGPWNHGDPVHETLTRCALQNAGVIAETDDTRDIGVWEYMRGVIWNDDPECMLFDDDPDRTDNFSSGLSFVLQFKKFEAEARRRDIGPDERLMARSHFGDLQFLHGMASRDGVPPAETRAAMLEWCRFTYEVAARRTAPETRLGDLPIGARFPALATTTVQELFGVKRIGIVPKRAIGSLLHIVQDSFAAGHVEREPLDDERRGRIVCFYSYARQDHGKHAQDDGWRGGKNVIERLRLVKGARDAIDACTAVLHLLHAGEMPAAWPAVEKQLLETALALSERARPSDPGPAFRTHG